MLMRPVSNKDEAKPLLEEIGNQGEGPGDPGDSHFRRFFNLYREVKNNPAAAAAIFALPHNPTTQGPAEGEMPAEGYIANRTAREWANLFDLRYRFLLATLAHLLILPDPDNKDPVHAKLKEWALFNEMPNLRQLANVIVNSSQHDPPQQLPDGRERKAGPPFTLPYTLQLSDQELDRWRLHEQLLLEAEIAINNLQAELPQTDPSQDLLTGWLDLDRDRLDFVRDQIKKLTRGNGSANA
jgi:hypothetical protein